jgi:uncharacterized damage-inducible protein DinB
MNGSLAERYRRWFEYERDAHAKVLAALAAVPEERRSAPEYRKAVTLLAHIAQARRVWLFRLGGLSEGPRPDEIFPEGLSLGEAEARLAEIQRAWGEYLAPLGDQEITRTFEFRAYDGTRFRIPVEDILAQLFGHSSYHRGQIAWLLRAMGEQPAATDLVLWSREPVA